MHLTNREGPTGKVVSDSAYKDKSKDCQRRDTTGIGSTDENVQLSRVQGYVLSHYTLHITAIFHGLLFIQLTRWLM